MAPGRMCSCSLRCCSGERGVAHALCRVPARGLRGGWSEGWQGSGPLPTPHFFWQNPLECLRVGHDVGGAPRVQRPYYSAPQPCPVTSLQAPSCCALCFTLAPGLPAKNLGSPGALPQPGTHTVLPFWVSRCQQSVSLHVFRVREDCYCTALWLGLTCG